MAVKRLDDSKISLLYDHNIDIDNRRIFLHEELESSSSLREFTESSYSHTGPVETIIRGLFLLDKTPGPIELWINSPGGLMSEMFALYDIIQTLKNPIHTVGFGLACSAAGLILACGDKRYATKHCFFMSHLGSASAEGDLFTMEDQVAFSKRYYNLWLELMEQNTNKNKAWWKRTLESKRRELWLNATEMKECGIIDDIWK